MTIVEGRILTPDGFRDGRLATENGRIVAIEPVPTRQSQLVVPGFIDLHCHGGGGAEVMQAGNAVRQVARIHAQHGTTAFLATTMTAPVDAIETALRAVSRATTDQQPDEAAIIGVHLEGPFISQDRLGAQPDFVQQGDIALMQALTELAAIKVVTCAPEADPDGRLTRWLDERDIRVQIGHSSCDYETACACFEHGRHGVTHMFNAMTPLHHRAPGIVGAALAHARYAEIIPDLLHVHPGAIRAALRAIPNLYAVTDASPASGMEDGEYRFGTQTVFKCGNGVRLADGTLAGSSLTMLQAFHNLVAIGLSVEEASARTARIPAEYLGLEDRGRIAVGAIADLVVLDGDLNLLAVMLRAEFLRPQ